MKYIFWPAHLNNKQKCFKDKALIAIAISLEETDYMVLDITDRLNISVDNSVYAIIGKRSVCGQWTFNIQEDHSVIEFKAPRLNKMQFFSLDPISLILRQMKNDTDNCSQKYAKFQELKGYDLYKSTNKTLRQSINLINLYYTHLKRLHEKYSELNVLYPTINRKFFSSITETSFYRIMLMIPLYLMVAACFIAGKISKVLRWKRLSLVDISVVAQQIDLRCQQICYFPEQYLKINKNITIRRELQQFKTYSEASADLASDLPCQFYPDYIRLYNTVWLIVNDISFGMILSAILNDNHEALVNCLSTAIEFCSYTGLKKLTILLSNNPFGIKLNQELSSFLSELFLWIIEFSYTTIIRSLSDKGNLSQFLRFTSSTISVIGLTFGLSLFIDFISLLSLHTYLFYHISCKLYYWQLNAMVNLFYLFRGKKRNILRHRIDYHNFQIDQLLMGTLLFTVLVFLLPTVVAFYISYTILQLASIYFEVFLGSWIGLVNHFPLFALLLRIKDPNRLPGGISISSVLANNNSIILELQNNPLKISSMFKPYLIVMNQIKERHLSFRTLNRIIKGLPIASNRNKLYQVLYSSLPARPVRISDIYVQILDTLPNSNKVNVHVKSE